MKTESLKELIEICRAGKCSVTLEACQTGIVAQVTAVRADVTHSTSQWLDRNDADAAEKLREAVARVQ